MEENHLNTGMYVIDKEYRILSVNRALTEFYPSVKIGDLCYKSLALQDAPCSTCPLANNDVLFFNPHRNQWISANAAEMDYPGHGECYTVQFRVRTSMGGTKREKIQLEKIDEYISEVQSADGKECVIAAYHEPGSPVFYANKAMINMMGYDSFDEMMEAVGGLIVNLVHPDDRKRVGREMQGLEVPGATFETSYRTQKKDGTWFWVIAHGKSILTADNHIAVLCVCTDMTTFLNEHVALQKEKEKLEQKTSLFETITENIPSGFHRCAAEEGCPFLYIGEHFTEIVGWTKEEIATEFDNLYTNLIWPEDTIAINIYEQMRQMRGKGNGYDTSIYRIKHKDGGYRWVTDSTMFVDCGEESFFQGTITDITPYIEEMEKAKAFAEASNKAKSTFLFNLSHDIRTPMNAILGFSHIIDENADNTNLVRETIGKIEQSGETLLNLLNDVLELSRIERGKEEVNAQPVHLHEYMSNLVEMFSKNMEEAGIDFKTEENIEHTYVMLDPIKVTRIGMNMLSNALKFTPTGGTITFGIKEEAFEGESATYRLYTKDTGIGMSEEFQKRAFEQFERERSATESGVTGSGLGMAIINRLTTLMGGTVSLESELGKGTEIAATLAFSLVKGTDTIEEKSMDKDLDLSGKKVLLVEDNDFNREIACYVLKSMGFVVEEAENGAVALDKMVHAQADTYQLVLMDIQMPVMDGYTATQEIRQIHEEEKAKIPIIAMTANAFEEDKKRCMDIGMNGHISKPIEREKLLQEIFDVL